MREENTRNAMIVEAKNHIAMLQEFITAVEDKTNDLVDISFEVDKITRHEGSLKFLLDNCEDY